MLTRTFTVDNATGLVPPLHSLAKAPIDIPDVIPPLPQPKKANRARDPTNLADPMLYAIARAERANIRTLATPEQNLAQTVLRMRLVDAMKR